MERSASEGFEGLYFESKDADKVLRYSGKTAALDFRWQLPFKSPASHVAAVWSGFIVPKNSGEYQFRIEASTEASLWINGQRWNATDKPLAFQAGQAYWLQLGAQRLASQGHLKLFWSLNGQPETVVPVGQLPASHPLRSAIRTQAVPLGQTINPNSGFENDLAGWNFYDPSGNSISLPYEGLNQSKVLKIAAQQSQSSVWWYTYDSDLAVPGAKYRLDAQLRADGEAHCTLNISGTDGRISQYFSTATAFQSFSSEFTLPESRNMLYLSLMNLPYGGYTGNCFFDDVKLSRVSEPPPIPEPAYNLLLNGEANADPNNSNLPESWRASGLGAGLVSPGHNGTPTAFQLAQNGENGMFEQTIPATALEPNKEYVLKAWMDGPSWACHAELNSSTAYGIARIHPQSMNQWSDRGVLFKTGTTVSDLTLALSASGPCKVDNVRFGPLQGVAPEPNETVQAVIDRASTSPTVFLGMPSYFSATGSTGSNLSYTWDFGDGTIISGDPEDAGDAIHFYQNPGYHTATLTIKDVQTGQSSSTAISIAVLPDINNMIVGRALRYGTPVKLDVKYPVEGLSYEWELSDNTKHVGAVVSPKLGVNGFYDITLSIYDNRSGVTLDRTPVAQSATRINYVAPRPLASIYGVQSGPSTISLDGQRYTKSATPLTYEWDFGDGTTGSGARVSHTYSKYGRYPITLKVTDDFGRVDYSYNVLVLGLTPSDETGDPSSFNPNVSMRADLGSGEIRSLGANSLHVPREVAQDMNDRKSRTEIVYSSKKSQTTPIRSLSNQSQPLNDVAIPFPFVLPSNLLNLEAHIIPAAYHSYFHTRDVINKWNGTSIARGQGWNFQNCRLITVYPEQQEREACAAAHIDRSFYSGKLVSGRNHQILQFVDDQGQPTQFNTDIPVYNGLRIPKLLINVFPDTVLEDDTPKLYTFDQDPGNTLVQIINVSSSDIVNTPDGEYARILIPVFAVDGAGTLLNSVSGAFDAFINAPGVYSHVPEGAMVNGRAEIEAYIPLRDYNSLSNKLNLTQIVVNAPGTQCGENSNYARIGMYIGGCQTIIASHDAPISALTGQGLLQNQSFGAGSLFDRNPFGYAGNPWATIESLFNHFVWGPTYEARVQFDRNVLEYSKSEVKLVVDFLPVAGEFNSIIVEGYKYAVHKDSDPVIMTLALSGLFLDATTGGALDVTSPIKLAYQTSKKTGGLVHKVIAESVTSIYQNRMNPLEAYNTITDAVRGLNQVYKAGGIEGVKAVDNLAARIASAGISCSLSTLSTASPTSCTDAKSVQAAIQTFRLFQKIGVDPIRGMRMIFNLTNPNSKYYADGALKSVAERLISERLAMDRMGQIIPNERLVELVGNIRGIYSEMAYVHYIADKGIKNIKMGSSAKPLRAIIDGEEVVADVDVYYDDLAGVLTYVDVKSSLKSLNAKELDKARRFAKVAQANNAKAYYYVRKGPILINSEIVKTLRSLGIEVKVFNY